MKKAWIILILVICLLAVAGGYMMLNSLFPKAPPIVFPHEDAISNVSVSSGDINLTLTVTEFEPMLKAIGNARPTRKMSVNETPSVREYYTVEISAERDFIYFVYAEDGVVYIEMPYTGIYKTNEKILNLIKAHFENH